MRKLSQRLFQTLRLPKSNALSALSQITFSDQQTHNLTLLQKAAEELNEIFNNQTLRPVDRIDIPKSGFPQLIKHAMSFCNIYNIDMLSASEKNALSNIFLSYAKFLHSTNSFEQPKEIYQHLATALHINPNNQTAKEYKEELEYTYPKIGNR